MARAGPVMRSHSMPIHREPNRCSAGKPSTKIPRRSSARRGTGSASILRGTIRNIDQESGVYMPDLADGELTEMKGSGAKTYVLKNTGGVYSCSCPAWRNQSITSEKRTCKPLRKLRGDAAEEARIGGALPSKPVKAKADSEEGD